MYTYIVIYLVGHFDLLYLTFLPTIGPPSQEKLQVFHREAET